MTERNYTNYNLEIGEIFINEYNRLKGTDYTIPPDYKDKGGFPDITFINSRDEELKVEIVGALPFNFGEKISAYDKLKNLFMKNGVKDGFIIVISLSQGITEKEIGKEIVNKNFFKFITDKCNEMNITDEAKKEFRKNLPLGSKIRKITIYKKSGNTHLEVYIFRSIPRLDPFADLQKAIKGKLDKYNQRRLSHTLLLLEGLKRPLPLGNKCFYVEEIKENLSQIKQLLRQDRFFKEVWLLASNEQEEYFVEQLI